MRNKGITLIALVITIIILIILAAVSVATLTGENGIIAKATEARKATEIAEVIERAKTDILGIQAGNNGKITEGQLKPILEKYFQDVPDELTDNLSALILITKNEYGNHEIKVSDIYNGNLLGGTESSTAQLAKEILKTDPTAIEAKNKSSYVKYNGLECRVLYNDGYRGLQIITAESVEDVALGYDDPEVTASDFTYYGAATIDDNFKKAAASYNNVVDNLNKKAKSYIDTKGIATDARCLGSNSNINR